MSSIGAVESVLNVSGLFQQAIKQHEANGPGRGRPFQRLDANLRTRFENRFGAALTSLGVSDEENAAIQDEIHSAIETVRQTGDGTGVGRRKIREAIAQILEDHGIDPEALRKELRPPHGPFGAPGVGGGAIYGSDGSLSNKAARQLPSGLGTDVDGGDVATAALLQGQQLPLDATA